MNKDIFLKELNDNILLSTPYMLMCMNSSLDIVKENTVLSEINNLDASGNNCLYYSAYGNNYQVFKYLVSLNFSDLNHENKYGLTIYDVVEVKFTNILENNKKPK